MNPIIPARLQKFLPALLITLCVALLYGHTLHAPWYMDDRIAITENPLVSDDNISAGRFLTLRGVAYLSFALNHKIAGFSLASFHSVNIIIHLACGGLIYLLLGRVFRNEPFWQLCGALLFVAHPLQTQAVTYIVQRMASLSALFFLLALYLFVRSREILAAETKFCSTQHLIFYLASLMAGLLALGVKENTAILPFALLLFVRCFHTHERSWRPLLLAIAPFLFVPLLLAITTILLPLARGGSFTHLTIIQPLSHMAGNTPLRYLMTELSVYWIYLRLLLLPYGQAFEHGYPVVKTLLTTKTVIAGFGLIILGWFGWHLRFSRPRLAFGISWFFLTLLVESSIIPLDPLFEHRLYLPLFGFIVALIELVKLIPQQWLAKILILSFFSIFAILTWQRNALWNEPIALYEDSLRKAPNNERTLINLANAYSDSGYSSKAELLALRALQLNPNFPFTYRCLGRIYLDQKRTAEALRYLVAGLQFTELTSSDEIYNMLAEAHMQQGQLNLAIDQINKALAIKRRSTTYNNLGAAYQTLGRWKEAEQSYRNALNLGPDEVMPHLNLARLLRQQGRLQEAFPEYAKALQLSPGNVAIRLEAEQLAKLIGR